MSRHGHTGAHPEETTELPSCGAGLLLPKSEQGKRSPHGDARRSRNMGNLGSL